LEPFIAQHRFSENAMGNYFVLFATDGVSGNSRINNKVEDGGDYGINLKQVYRTAALGNTCHLPVDKLILQLNSVDKTPKVVVKRLAPTKNSFGRSSFERREMRSVSICD
jgi:hypothetical protein